MRSRWREASVLQFYPLKNNCSLKTCVKVSEFCFEYHMYACYIALKQIRPFQIIATTDVTFINQTNEVSQIRL